MENITLAQMEAVKNYLTGVQDYYLLEKDFLRQTWLFRWLLFPLFKSAECVRTHRSHMRDLYNLFKGWAENAQRATAHDVLDQAVPVKVSHH